MSILMHMEFLFILCVSKDCIFASICEPALLSWCVEYCYLFIYIGGLTQGLW